MLPFSKHAYTFLNTQCKEAFLSKYTQCKRQANCFQASLLLHKFFQQKQDFCASP